MGVEHRDRETVHAEGDTSSMRNFAYRIDNVPRRSEVVAMVIEAHTGGWTFIRTQRNQKLELEGQLNLAYRLHLANPAEEGIARVIDPEGEPETARDVLCTYHPTLAKV